MADTATNIVISAKDEASGALAKISGHVDINELYHSYYRESAQDIAARL